MSQNQGDNEQFDPDAPLPTHDAVRSMAETVVGFLNRASISGQEAEALSQAKNFVSQIGQGEIVILDQKTAMALRNAQHELEQMKSAQKPRGKQKPSQRTPAADAEKARNE